MTYVVQRREDHGIYEDLNSHLLTLTQLAEESTAYTMIFSTLYHEFVCHVEHYSVELDT